MKIITIGIFCDSFFPLIDGVVMVVDNYAKRLAKYANVIVFVPKYKEEYDDSRFNYKVVRCHSLKVPFLDYSLPTPSLDIDFEKELRGQTLDIVHIHSPFTLGKSGIKYAKKHKIPVIATMHSQFKQDFKRAVKNESFSKFLTSIVINVFEKCDECWAVNSEVARIFHEDYGYSKLPRIMNNATEMLPLKDKEEKVDKLKKELNINNEKILLFVGRLNKLKNIFFLVEALKEIKDRLNYKMIFVGSGQDEEELKSLIKKYNLNDKFILTGKITDREVLATYYAMADLFLFPSLYDASSIVQIEAACQNTPGLFLRGSATSATVSDNINGFIENNNINDYANRIIEILNNKELLDKVSSNAYSDLYVNWDMKIEEVYKIYLDLIEKK